MSRIPFPLRLLLLAVSLLLAASLRARDAEAPPVGRLQITSEPPKATVLIDRQVRGETPLLLSDLSVGQHLVTLRKQGFVEAWKTVELQAQEARAIEFHLETLTGLLLLQSSPSNADVTLGGVALGRTPLMISTLPMGRHRIKVATPGYQAKEVEVSLEACSVAVDDPLGQTLNNSSLAYSRLSDQDRIILCPAR